MKIEVTPVVGTANQFTVSLIVPTAGTYRLAFSGDKDHATKVAQTMRKSINRSGKKATTGGVL